MTTKKRGGRPLGNKRKYPNLDEALIMGGLYQCDLAELCRVSPRVFCSWMTGLVRMPVKHSIEIANFFESPAEWLFMEMGNEV